MRISDWSSDVCSSDFPGLPLDRRVALVRDFSVADPAAFRRLVFHVYDSYYQDEGVCAAIGARPGPPFPRGYAIPAGDDRKSVVSGKSGSVRVDFGGRRIIKKKKKTTQNYTPN